MARPSPAEVLALRVETIALVDSAVAANKSAVVSPNSKLVVQTGALSSADCTELKVVRQFFQGRSLAVSDCVTNITRHHVVIEVAACNGGVRCCFPHLDEVFGTQWEPLLIGISVTQEGLCHPVSLELKLWGGDSASFIQTFSPDAAKAYRDAFGAHPFPEALQVHGSIAANDRLLLLANFSLGLSWQPLTAMQADTVFARRGLRTTATLPLRSTLRQTLRRKCPRASRTSLST